MKRSLSVEYACVPSYRLDDRIRELCAQAIAADDTSFAEVLSELQRLYTNTRCSYAG
jgi:hypothetical protein